MNPSIARTHTLAVSCYHEFIVIYTIFARYSPRAFEGINAKSKEQKGRK